MAQPTKDHDIAVSTFHLLAIHLDDSVMALHQIIAIQRRCDVLRSVPNRESIPTLQNHRLAMDLAVLESANGW